jgi:hypothetical protein
VNPWEIWFFTVLTAAISFAGYVTMRVFGPGKGVVISGLAGALASSAAVTLAFARRASAGGPVRPLAGAAVLAAMVSVLRVLVVLTLVKQELAFVLAPPLLAAGLVLGAIGAAMVMRKADGTETETDLGNPFDLVPLLVFAASFGVVAAASAALTQYFGSASVIVTSGVSGVMDVDVATLTAARLAGEGAAVASLGRPHGPIAPADAETEIVGERHRHDGFKLDAAAGALFVGNERAERVVVHAGEVDIRQEGGVARQLDAIAQHDLRRAAEADAVPALFLADDRRIGDRR